MWWHCGHSTVTTLLRTGFGGGAGASNITETSRGSNPD